MRAPSVPCAFLIVKNMAQRRMFSPDIVDSDAFLDMPVSSQVLYFHLAMRADDDGFISPRKVMRLINVGDDDLKVLLTKRFLLPFESGVVVIKHWLIHNLIRKDRYKETRYTEEKKLLKIKENGAYTEVLRLGQPNGNQMAPQVRLGKVSIGKDKKEEDIADKSASPLFKEITEHYFQAVQTKQGFKPSFDGGDGKALKSALSEFTPAELKDQIDYYLNSKKAAENGITLKAVFSTHSKNMWKQNQHKTKWI